MYYDIIEAITEYYKKDKDIIAGCMSYLYTQSKDDKLKYEAAEWCDLNNYCPYCGQPLGEKIIIDKIPYGDTYTNLESTIYYCSDCDYEV